MNKNKKIAVFGIGNSLMGDDGVAEAVLHKLSDTNINDTVRLINAGGDPLRILQEMPDLDAALVIDAADMGLRAGDIRVFRANEAEFPYNPSPISAHGISLAYVIDMLKLMKLDEHLYLIGIQPYKITARNYISDELEKKADEIASLIVKKIQHILEQTA